ncbi:uncharacterized protein [Oryza sativa Japonica Group]|jgi:hypothetical protein|uniref:Uncharacterized protein n=1 Tax=Oryza sativa subsp. japonica TaxID=39947 RepID=Q5ZBZ1_ORYSJ|nr:uncharacterized protein LOC107276664 [Oryza sativa Japonica Group]XP_015630664.1 uncharacterized protein LOC107276664 [Oryza sativa Japonica Group]EAZ13710.1 hypothetical protein OsJ_03633 [Oryza sativa Japonica Group]KAF2952538.1 hypothetical protein DAI22_01g343100 [Oryza sativa Japonica Group]KAF2952539.1 hypothetical protein DAI22_01g343100 [Oryza sativa Japonica Group]BAD52942.1 hypothetical protein [Oryza sativa Japonica Group]
MGNEMGNNNVTGQQVSEETAQGFDRTIEHLDGPPSLNSTNDKGKDGTKDLDKSKLLKDPVITNGGNEQMVSIKGDSFNKNKDLDDKNRGSLQDHSLTQDNDQSCHLPSTQDDEPLSNKEIERVTNLPETTASVSITIEDTTSNKDSSTLVEKIKLVHKTTERSEEINIGNSQSLLKENMEGPLEDEESGMRDDLIGEDKAEKLDQGQTAVSIIENLLMPMQGGSTSSTETITTDYLDADDSDIKEVVIENEPTGKRNSLYVRPADDTNLKTFKNDRARIPDEKEDISEISQRATVETGIGSCEVIDEGKKTHGLKDQNKDTCGALDIGEVVSKFQSSLTDTSATDAIELEKHELNKRGDDVAGEISDSLTRTEEHNAIERTHTDQERDAKDAAVKDPADNSDEEKKSDCTHDIVSLVEVNGKKFTGLDSFLSYQLSTVNEEKVQTEVREGLFRPSSPLQLIEDFHKRDLKVDSPHNNEETIISTYEVETTDIHDTLAVSQFDRPQQMLLEEPEVVKFENGSILSCMQLVEKSSKTDTFFPHGSKQEKDSASTTAIGLTSESNLEKVMVKVDFPAESNQKKIIADTDKASQEGYLLQIPASRRDASEETPLLKMVENTSSFSFSNEQHSKVVECIPMTSISMMQVKDDGDEEYEKSPLLSPREQEGENFMVPNHSVRNKKPLQSLTTGESVCMQSSLKEQEVPNNSTMVSSPRSTRKQKPRSSIFASCMCCATATN